MQNAMFFNVCVCRRTVYFDSMYKLLLGVQACGRRWFLCIFVILDMFLETI